MNTGTPLAAALLLLATSASAQFSGATGSGLNLTGSSPAPFSLAAKAAPVNDFTFKCDTPPYEKCTDVQMNQRQSILMSRTCPEPVSNACSSWLIANTDTNATQLLGTRPDVPWVDPEKCNFIPCATRTSPTGAGATESGLPYDQQPGFIGPPAPPKNQGPQPFADASSFQQALRDQESLTPGKVIDLGNNTYAVDTGDGNYSIGGLCSGAPCNGMPKPADQIPGLADKIQESKSLNSGNQALNGDNPGGFSPMSNKSAPQTPSLANSGRTTGAPSPAATSASDEARANGGDAGDFIRSSFADSGSGDSGSFASNGSYAPGADEVVKTEAPDLNTVGVTFSALKPHAAGIDDAAAAFNAGKMTGFASPNAPPSNRLAEPPVDEASLGKIQAVHQ